MTGGRIILPPTNPSLDANGNPVSGSTLTYYENGTTTPVSIYSDIDLTVPLANPLPSDAAGIFPQVWAPNDIGYSIKWSRTGLADVTFDDIFPDLDSSAVGNFITANQSQVSLGSNVNTSFGTAGVGLIENAFTQTDSTTGAGTVATAYASTFGAVTFATPLNAITITNAFGLYLKDPVAGSHVTLTNKYALGVDSFRCVGALSVGGHATIEGVTSTGATGTGNLVFSAAPTFTGKIIAAGMTVNGASLGIASLESAAGTNGTAAISAFFNGTSGKALHCQVQNSAVNFVEFFFTTNLVGSISTTGTATAYNTSSDERLKNILEKQRDFLSMIREIWIGDAEFKSAPGDPVLSVIAQQIAPIFPDAVTPPAQETQLVIERDENGDIARDEEGNALFREETDEEAQARIWHAEYGRLGILALKGCQLLLEIVDRQEARLAALEAKP